MATWKSIRKTESDRFVWKKAYSAQGYVIVKLLLPKGTTYHIPRLKGRKHRKCRAEKAIVVRFETMQGKEYTGEVVSLYDRDFKYISGSTVVPTRKFDTYPSICATGIHFYLLRAGARRHQ